MKKHETIQGNGGDGPNTGLQYGATLTVDQKAAIIGRAMRDGQPRLENFHGKKDYSDRMLQKDSDRIAEINENLARKNMNKIGRAATDRYAKDAEPLLAYILGDDRMLPTRDSFAFLASDYDDKVNGVDIVFGVENKDESDYIVCGVDVATGTNRDNIQDKFQAAGQWHGDTPPWCAYVKYCQYDGQYWKEFEAPKFILGMMPSRLDDATEKIQIGNEGMIMGRDTDPATDFKLMSEMYEQIRFQRKVIGKDPRGEADQRLLVTLKSLQLAVSTKLYRVLEVEGEGKEARKADFDKKYAKAKAYYREDLTYRNILDETKHQDSLLRGHRSNNSVEI